MGFLNFIKQNEYMHIFHNKSLLAYDGHSALLKFLDNYTVQNNKNLVSMCAWCMCACVYVHVCLHVCAQKNEFASPFHLWPISYTSFVVIFFVALSSCAEYYFYGHYS